MDNPEAPSMLQVYLKFGRGAKVLVGQTNCTLSPVAAVLGYISARCSEEGPFFRFKSGSPLTKSLFTKHIRTALQELGLPFGAATAAAKSEIEDSTIKTLGRWNSSAFLAYIRSLPEQLAHTSRILAQS